MYIHLKILRWRVHGPFFWGGGVFHTPPSNKCPLHQNTVVVQPLLLGPHWSVWQSKWLSVWGGGVETKLKRPIFCIYYKTLTINIKAIPKLLQKTRNRFFHKTPFFQIAMVQYLDFWFTSKNLHKLYQSIAQIQP